MIKPGFYRQTNDAYHTGPGISKSGLSRIKRSPAHFKTPQKDKAAFTTGEYFHTATLEPERFEREYAPLPASCRPGSGEGMKKRKEEFLESAFRSGQTIISQDDYDTARRMADAVYNCKEAMELLSEGEAELSGYWYDPDYKEILCKIRMDWINKTDRVIVDLKSCTDAQYYQFRASAFANDYHMQAGWYLYGATHITRIEHHDFYFIAVEKEPPYGIKVYQANEEMINLGLIDCQKALEVYAKCLENDEWPNYSTEPELLMPPEYLLKQQMRDSVIWG